MHLKPANLNYRLTGARSVLINLGVFIALFEMTKGCKDRQSTASKVRNVEVASITESMRSRIEKMEFIEGPKETFKMARILIESKTITAGGSVDKAENAIGGCTIDIVAKQIKGEKIKWKIDGQALLRKFVRISHSVNLDDDQDFLEPGRKIAYTEQRPGSSKVEVSSTFDQADSTLQITSDQYRWQNGFEGGDWVHSSSSYLSIMINESNSVILKASFFSHIVGGDSYVVTCTDFQ